LRGALFDSQSGMSAFDDLACLVRILLFGCGAGLTLPGSNSSKYSFSVMDISILYEQAQRLLSGDIYRRFKSVMAHLQQCICKAPKNDRCLTPSI
jgi:hypothetical protein